MSRHRCVLVVIQAPCVLSVLLDAAEHLLQYCQQLHSQGGGTRFTAPMSFNRAINSKACRGAIMFGDVLSRRQCVDMISRLGATCLPFQCAVRHLCFCFIFCFPSPLSPLPQPPTPHPIPVQHGRPSVVPLVRIIDALAAMTRHTAPPYERQAPPHLHQTLVRFRRLLLHSGVAAPHPSPSISAPPDPHSG